LRPAALAAILTVVAGSAGAQAPEPPLDVPLREWNLNARPLERVVVGPGRLRSDTRAMMESGNVPTFPENVLKA
jgi:hypothetical protein